MQLFFGKTTGSKVKWCEVMWSAFQWRCVFSCQFTGFYWGFQLDQADQYEQLGQCVHFKGTPLLFLPLSHGEIHITCFFRKLQQLSCPSARVYIIYIYIQPSITLSLITHCPLPILRNGGEYVRETWIWLPHFFMCWDSLWDVLDAPFRLGQE